MACCGRTCCSVCAKCILIGLSIVTIICIIGAVLSPSAIESLVLTLATNAISKIFVLTPTSELFERWEKPTVPAYQKYYFFEVLNPDDVLDGAKPKVVERGPYVYRLDISRYNVTFDTNDSLSYSWHTYWTFEPEMSAGLENDTITTINVPFVSTAIGAKYQEWIARLTVSAIASIHKQGMFMTLSVHELLWGYEDEVLKMLQSLAGVETVPTYTIGILHGRNGSSLSAVVDTGIHNPMMLNELKEFNGSKELTCWETKEANMINGTDGSIFHSSINRDEILYVYNPLNFRSLPFTYEKDVTVSDIEMLKFSVPSYIYANVSAHPPNDDFCAGGACSPTGLLNVTACTGAPMSVSLPHFLYASPDILNATEGLRPNETDHGSSIIVEPITGVPYVQNRRVQMNVFMESVDGIRQTYGIPSMHYPLLWIELSNTLPESYAEEHKEGFALAVIYGSYAQYACIGLAVFSFALMVILIICLQTKCSKSRTRPKDHNDAPYHVNFSKGKKPKGNVDSQNNTYVSIETSVGGHTVEIEEQIPSNPSISSSTKESEKDTLSEDLEEGIIMRNVVEDAADSSRLTSEVTAAEITAESSAQRDWLSDDVEDALMRWVSEETPLRSDFEDDVLTIESDYSQGSKCDLEEVTNNTVTINCDETMPLRTDSDLLKSEITRHSNDHLEVAVPSSELSTLTETDV